MPVSELLYEGMILMFLGMGIVFSFLAILVLAMKAMSSLSQRLDNAEPDLAATPSMPPAQTVSDKLQNDDLIAVITAAVRHYRTRA